MIDNNNIIYYNIGKLCFKIQEDITMNKRFVYAVGLLIVFLSLSNKTMALDFNEETWDCYPPCNGWASWMEGGGGYEWT